MEKKKKELKPLYEPLSVAYMSISSDSAVLESSAIPLSKPFPGLKPKIEPGSASTCEGFALFI